MVALDRVFHCFRNGTARTQTIDFGRAESELPEKLITMFSNVRGALRRYLGNSMHLKRATDRGRPEEFCLAQRSLDRDTGGPYALPASRRQAGPA